MTAIDVQHHYVPKQLIEETNATANCSASTSAKSRGAVCGNPADSTLSLGYMLFSGLFDRFPNLKLCALHGGGFLPYHLGRFDKEFTTGTKARPSQSSKAPSAYLKNLYFDTLVYDVDTLEYLKAKVGGAKLMLGTDYPYTLGDWLGGENIHALKCSVAEKDANLEGNARRLLKL